MSDVRYIENRRHLATLTMALNFAAKTSEWVNKERRNYLTGYKIYLKNREYIHESMQSWDCGRQDAWGDSFDQDMQRLHALRLARKIQRGDATHMMRLIKQITGEL